MREEVVASTPFARLVHFDKPGAEGQPPVLIIPGLAGHASVLDLSPTEDLPVKRFDLMMAVNARGTFVLSQACLPHLRRSGSGHILTLSPPLNMSPAWLGKQPGYMLAKYGMTLLTPGFAEEYRADGLRANCLWPRTTIATAAVKNLLGGDEVLPEGTDLDAYRIDPRAGDLDLDIFVDPDLTPSC